MYATLVAVRVGIREFRAKLSDYLDRAKNGEVVVITERGKPVAELSGASKLEELIAQGRVRPAQRPKRPLPPLRGRELQRPNLSDTVIEGHGH